MYFLIWSCSYVGRKHQRRAPAQPKAKRGSKRPTEVAIDVSSGDEPDEKGPSDPATHSSESAPAATDPAAVFWRRLMASSSAGWVGRYCMVVVNRW